MELLTLLQTPSMDVSEPRHSDANTALHTLCHLVEEVSLPSG